MSRAAEAPKHDLVLTRVFDAAAGTCVQGVDRSKTCGAMVGPAWIYKSSLQGGPAHRR